MTLCVRLHIRGLQAKLGLCLGWKEQWICCITRGRQGGKGGERRGGEGRGGKGREGRGWEGRVGEGRNDCYAYSNGATILKIAITSRIM